MGLTRAGIGLNAPDLCFEFHFVYGLGVVDYSRASFNVNY